MPHISETQLKQFQTVLLDSLEKLRQDMADILMRSTHTGHNSAAKQLQKISSDELPDLAIKFEIPCISHKIIAMKSIDAALNNMQIGMYGLCADCEEEIAIEQLNIDATSQRCLDCDNKYQKQKYNNYKL